MVNAGLTTLSEEEELFRTSVREFAEGEVRPKLESMEHNSKLDADLIIIMTQQELEWTDFFIGTAAQEVINESDIPVLCIRPVERGKLMEFVTS